jgi:prophage antirepressor-like protein
MGYQPKSLSHLVRREWSEEFKAPQDLVKIEGDDLQTLKQLVEEHSTSCVGARARSVLLLTRSGLHKVCLVSNKSAA